MDQPPPYTSVPSTTSTHPPPDSKTPYNLNTSDIPQQLASPSSRQQLPILLSSPFPQSFGIYHAPGSSSNMHIALAKESAPILYISTHGGFSSQPSVILHSRAQEGSKPLGTADFHSFSRTMDLLLYNPSSLVSGPAFSTTVDAEATFSFSMTFSAPVTSSQIEKFEWKNSSGADVASLAGRSHGMKLVLQRTGEVIAVWAPPNEGYKKKGKMAFIANRGSLGVLMEIAAVISVAGIMEKRRRQKKNSRGAAAGGGGGFGGGAGGGGGGC